MQFAGFWRRFLAHIIDFLILFLAVIIISLILGVLAGLSGNSTFVDENLEIFVISITAGFYIASILYQSVFLSSRHMATPGRMAMGIVVSDFQGMRLNFGLALWRSFLYELLVNSPWFISVVPLIATLMEDEIVSNAFYLAYSVWVLAIILMQVFTAKRQTLYDKIAGTIVLIKASHGIQASSSSPGAVNTLSEHAGNYVFFGFDSNGYIIRHAITKGSPNLTGQGVLIGRDESKCDFVLSDKSVSRMHARLTSHSGDLYLEDLGSTNQTKVNGSAIASGVASKIRNGDILHFGDVELTFNC